MTTQPARVRQGLTRGLALGAALLAGTLATTVNAAPIPIAGYDIIDAVLSGHGFWAHAFGGTITSGAPFIHNGFPGTAAIYSGVGSGTLNDGVIGSSISTTQLFVFGNAIDPEATLTLQPTIFATLPFVYTIDTIELYQGDISTNSIPGTLTGVTVMIFGPNGTASDTFALAPFGPGTNAGGAPTNGRITIPNTSPLFGLPAFTVVLSDFQGGTRGWFSLTEIMLDGALHEGNGVPVPAPASLAVFGMALAGLGLALRRRRG